MSRKFSTFKGVFVPSTEAILGTVLFLLLPVLAADVGLVYILPIVVLSHSVTLSTSFSLADCATNLNNIGGGGMYALSKKSLGKAFGGSIGIQLYLAQAASIGFYCIGFTEPLQPILAPFLQVIPLFQGTDPSSILLQKQVLATVVFIIFFFTVIMGADFTLKIQMLILVLLFGSLVVIFISPFIGIEFNGQALFQDSIKSINLFGNRAITLSIFFMAFTQFFPAVTGIDAGVGMSGELKDPKRSLVRGTFTALFITFIVYMASSIIFTMMDQKALITDYVGNSPTGFPLTELLGLGMDFPGNLPGIMILLGILFSTSSSALSFFMTAPRTAQSLCMDDILPRFMGFLAKDFRQGGTEPRYATVVTSLLGISIIWIGNINTAAMIVGISFLIVYGWVNGSAFLERISNNPTFRPTSRGHWLISLYGFLACIVAISLFSWIAGICIFITQYAIFQFLLKYKAQGKLEGVWWGVLFSFITRALRILNKIVQGTKNWRPILTAITFTGGAHCPDRIASIAEMIASYQGLVNINILHAGDNDSLDPGSIDFKIPTSIIKVSNPTQSIMSLIQVSFPSGLSPNTVLMEYEERVDSVKIINKILSLNKNMLILKNGSKLHKRESIDIWWRGERNGNLMVLLGYIMKNSISDEEKRQFKIRIIRVLDKGEDHDQAYRDMSLLLGKARLSGEVVILPFTGEPFVTIALRTSKDSDLVMMGLPGSYTDLDKGRDRLFNLDEYFFNKDIRQYDAMPALLFVKSAAVIDLLED